MKIRRIVMEIKIGKEKKDKGMDEWEIRECADTLIKAESIKADSKKMKEVSKELAKRKKAIEAVPVKDLDELKERANSKESEEY